MPELPEVETTKNLLIPHIKGKKIQDITLNRKNLRFDFPDMFDCGFDNITITDLQRHGKYMLWHCDNHHTIIVHLGMTGRFLVAHQKTVFPDFYYDYKINPVHEHCIFHFTCGTRISYYDPRRFGFFDVVPTDTLYDNKFLKILGIDGLNLVGRHDDLFAKLKTKNAPIKNMLLDQSIIAGVGNIYASEALWRAKIHPSRAGSSLDITDVEKLTNHIHDILHESIQGGGSTLKDYRTPDGDTGHYQNTFNVYDCKDKKCPDTECDGIIEKMTHANRATFFCTMCQI